jgi:hypothetical protein
MSNSSEAPALRFPTTHRAVVGAVQVGEAKQKMLPYADSKVTDTYGPLACPTGQENV